MKTAELTGPELDYWVAKVEGYRVEGEWVRCPNDAFVRRRNWKPMQYSSDWARGGPIIEREKIAVWADGDAWRAIHPTSSDGWYENGVIDCGSFDGFSGDTLLIAAMRALVSSKFGEEVDSSLILTQPAPKSPVSPL